MLTIAIIHHITIFMDNKSKVTLDFEHYIHLVNENNYLRDLLKTAPLNKKYDFDPGCNCEICQWFVKRREILSK